MPEWDAVGYSRCSSLQEAMGQQVLALLDLKGSERVLDVGCGDGKITAAIAARVPQGSVFGRRSFTRHDSVRAEAAFAAFSAVGCVAWTERLPAAERTNFIGDVLDRYRTIAADGSEEGHTFKFYQMDIRLLAI
jgi:SAM-dependent methyltransferase